MAEALINPNATMQTSANAYYIGFVGAVGRVLATAVALAYFYRAFGRRPY